MNSTNVSKIIFLSGGFQARLLQLMSLQAENYKHGVILPSGGGLSLVK
jgi:hypothetical protein